MDTEKEIDIGNGDGLGTPSRNLVKISLDRHCNETRREKESGGRPGEGIWEPTWNSHSSVGISCAGPSIEIAGNGLCGAYALSRVRAQW